MLRLSRLQPRCRDSSPVKIAFFMHASPLASRAIYFDYKTSLCDADPSLNGCCHDFRKVPRNWINYEPIFKAVVSVPKILE